MIRLFLLLLSCSCLYGFLLSTHSTVLSVTLANRIQSKNKLSFAVHSRNAEHSQEHRRFIPHRTTTNTNAFQLHATAKMTACRDLVQYLVNEEQCYTTSLGAKAFGDACAPNAVYDDRYEPQPIVGKNAITNHLVNQALA
jgi:hypothetical protein